MPRGRVMDRPSPPDRPAAKALVAMPDGMWVAVRHRHTASLAAAGHLASMAAPALPARQHRMQMPSSATDLNTHRRLQARLVALSSVPFMGMSAAPAFACTLCHSEVGVEVRAIVFGPDFLSNLAALLAPVPLLVAATYVIRKLLP